MEANLCLSLNFFSQLSSSLLESDIVVQSSKKNWEFGRSQGYSKENTALQIEPKIAGKDKNMFFLSCPISQVNDGLFFHMGDQRQP